jgi:hypothetical protein
MQMLKALIVSWERLVIYLLEVKYGLGQEKD